MRMNRLEHEQRYRRSDHLATEGGGDIAAAVIKARQIPTGLNIRQSQTVAGIIEIARRLLLIAEGEPVTGRRRHQEKKKNHTRHPDIVVGRIRYPDHNTKKNTAKKNNARGPLRDAHHVEVGQDE